MEREEIAEWFKDLQDQICAALETCEGKASFEEDQWERPGGGGGRSRVIQGGDVFEKGGVNFSAVHGELPENIRMKLGLNTAKFFATGVSIVIHPVNPNVPIIHMNVRHFELEGETWWFGGGIDLTPHYVVDEDAKYFHNALKTSCDVHNPSYYAKFKEWADDYFFIKHRKETRGIGGIFFDRINTGDKAEDFDFVKAIGETFAPTYVELVNRHKNRPFTLEQQDWQALRRSRYVEFNLLYDKGTKFGLDTDGRTESILMSMPPMAKWAYDYKPQMDSPEEQTLTKLVKGIDWI
jgi:coproporphyrinogen III oxidase